MSPIILTRSVVPGRWIVSTLMITAVSGATSTMQEPSSSELLLTAGYDEEQILDHPFMIPEDNLLDYRYPCSGDQHQEPSYPVFNETTNNYQPNQWENCSASLEEVESAVFSTSSSSSSCQVVEVQRLDTKSEVLSFNICDQEVSSTNTSPRRSRRSKKKKTAYKHVPHAEKPAHIVEKRNARERRRVEAVNSAFLRLRKAVPLDNKRGKRVSKVKILQRAIDYILNMQSAIDNHDGVQSKIVYDDKDDDHLFAF